MNHRFPMPGGNSDGQMERELAYYRRECNTLGAGLLRLQEEQSQAFREARRSRTVAKLIREAYRLIDHSDQPEELGQPMLATVLENTLCDRAALLQEHPRGSGQFSVSHSVGLPGPVPGPVLLPVVPAFFFTTSRSRIEPPAYQLTAILRVPYILWAYDETTGIALILGNQSESNVSRPFEEADQEIVEGALSVYIDIALRKRAEVEMREARIMAEEASSTRTRFLATLTHELRTPLNAIIGFSEMMATGSRYALTPEQIGEFNTHVFNSATHLLALINEILDYSALARGRTPLTLRWTDVGELIAASLGAASAAAAERGVRLATELPAQKLWIRVDRTRFRQILDNLLSNAIRFTGTGGVVAVHLLLPQEGGLRLEVRDNGIGMRPEDIPRALEPFEQIENPFSRSASGTGLGLPITRGLVQAHGGSFSVQSEFGVGTTVAVLLPAEAVHRGASPPGGRALGDAERGLSGEKAGAEE
ncbi:sensor histidine kinase [Teichococcus oryzae]|uniref:histidine kinase n=1 Tax=Teichococcus oryzae TaxID=1608942 RepID=A0A5B2TA41_9PROT|nr:HAMP domain-containing sensor histidine kinase [Pseudoroseomonas oryzae]KAA2211432.1 HAMP domain-containing histidine kinase [Pseudoroseomonas oryzae]